MSSLYLPMSNIEFLYSWVSEHGLAIFSAAYLTIFLGFDIIKNRIGMEDKQVVECFKL